MLESHGEGQSSDWGAFLFCLVQNCPLKEVSPCFCAVYIRHSLELVYFNKQTVLWQTAVRNEAKMLLEKRAKSEKWEIAPAVAENASEMLHRTHFFPSKPVQICSLWDRGKLLCCDWTFPPLRCWDYTSYKYCMSKRQRSGFKWWNSLHKPATTFRQLWLSLFFFFLCGSRIWFPVWTKCARRKKNWVGRPLKFTAARAFKHFQRVGEKGNTSSASHAVSLSLAAD